MKELLNPLIQSSNQAASGRNTQRIYRKRKKRDCLSSSNIYHTGSVGTIIIDIFIHTRLSLAYAQIHTLKVMLIFTTFWSLIFLWRSVGSNNIHQDSHAPCLSFKSVWKCVWQNILDRNRKCVEHCVSLQVWQEWGWDVNPTGEIFRIQWNSLRRSINSGQVGRSRWLLCEAGHSVSEDLTPDVTQPQDEISSRLSMSTFFQHTFTR